MKPNETQNEEMEIDLKEVALELLDHWKLIVASTILVAAIAFVWSSYVTTPMYESTSELYVLSKSTSITSLTDLQTGTNLTNDYIVVVEGRPVLEQVIKNLGLDYDYQDFLEKVTLNNPDDSRILEITVEDADPNVAKTIADEIAEVSSEYIAEKMDQDPPTIIQYGYADNEPSSPDVGKNTAVGALLGALLSLIVIVVSYLLNDTVMTADDIEKKLGMNVLGVLPYEESMDDTLDGNKKSEKKKRDSSKTA